MAADVIELPYPPSLNHYWRHVMVGRRPATLISREGRAFRTRVCALLAADAGGGLIRKPPAGGRIALAMDAFPPDRRRRDLDNLIKATADALQHAGVYEDDSQIDLLAIRRREPVTGGRLDVRIEPLPQAHCPLCGAGR